MFWLQASKLTVFCLHLRVQLRECTVMWVGGIYEHMSVQHALELATDLPEQLQPKHASLLSNVFTEVVTLNVVMPCLTIYNPPIGHSTTLLTCIHNSLLAKRAQFVMPDMLLILKVFYHILTVAVTAECTILNSMPARKATKPTSLPRSPRSSWDWDVHHKHIIFRCITFHSTCLLCRQVAVFTAVLLDCAGSSLVVKQQLCTP